jgi:hypothetical protein
MRVFKKIFQSLALLVPLIYLGGCGGGSSDSGQLKVSLTDSATDQYNAVYITVDSIEVHAANASDDSWQTVATPHKTVNLLDLANGVREEFNLATLPAGHYTQVRLHLSDTPDSGINILSQSHPFANYVIDTTNAVHELTVPSGFQTGVKIVHEFDVNANSTTELILDFDATASVVIAGNSGKYILKPTIKILETTLASILSGTVKDANTGLPLPGALVSAQVFNASAADEKDKVTVQGATISDANGNYKLFIEPGTYNIVGYKQGYSPNLTPATLTAGSTPLLDLLLTPASATGTIGGTVTIAGADNQTFVTSSARQDVTVNAVLTTIELVSVNVANGSTYSINLPVGGYSVVSSTFGKTTQKAPATVTANKNTPLDLNF